MLTAVVFFFTYKHLTSSSILYGSCSYVMCFESRAGGNYVW